MVGSNVRVDSGPRIGWGCGRKDSGLMHRLLIPVF